MTLVFNAPGPRGTTFGGLRKLYDQADFLAAAGLPTAIGVNLHAEPGDLLVLPEIYHAGIRDIDPGVDKVIMNQNGHYHGPPSPSHAFMTTPELRAVLCVSEYTLAQVEADFPNLPCPAIRFHSSVVGREGTDAPFAFGPWPRQRTICYFQRKRMNEATQLRARLEGQLNGWTFATLDGMTDAGIAETMGQSAIFLSFSQDEGWPAPLAEGIASGCYVIGFTGGGGEEMAGCMTVVPDGNLAEMEIRIREATDLLDRYPGPAEAICQQTSAWMFKEYDRDNEKAELYAIMADLYEQVQHGVLA